MYINLKLWKELQQKKLFNNNDVEYIYEDAECFNIVFDKDMKEVNYKIFKEDINNKQDLFSEFFHVSKIKEIHFRLNECIYKELLYKLNRHRFY
ncbi:hypothetical protein CRU98_01860 [Arcobacter sp. CECT 8986]|uniref:hypothetical protein n=1 Tax=Arcobacter sp. CECT 8986 TaxID=2044507 RepID=UPI001009EFC8|nr:hypothetical protein [Arcobacter sp. CECT 8986]RXK01219.1 hypothetical protein CRU98_01860 [Arcobacter sp. CECT 8986]